MTATMYTPPSVHKALEKAVGPSARTVLRDYRRDLAYRARVQRIVAEAPPLSDDQKARIRLALHGVLAEPAT
ncbi:hypothetical protein ACWD62_04360 [Streptomyces sp. NPDC005146]